MRSLALLSIFLLAFSSVVYAQERDTLRISAAIEQGLENNYSIRLIRNDQDIAENNNTLGNAGLLPVLELVGSFNESTQNTITRFTSSSIPDIDNSGVVTTRLSYGVNASWTVFDGLTQYATLDRLSVNEDISENEARLQIELTLANIISTYYQIAGTQKAYAVLQNSVEISRERIRIAETRKDIGSGSEYDLLQARADYNADLAALTRAQTTLKRAKLSLKEILSDSSDQEYEVSRDIILREPLSLNSLLEDARQQNKDLNISRLNRSRAKAELNELKGDWFPELILNGGYTFNRTEASIGFTDFSETSGFNYGVTARLSLFEGFNRSREIQNARIELKNEELRTEQFLLQLDNQIRQIYIQYSDALSLIELEEENLQYAEQSLEIALERFRLGTINSVELREVQQTFLDAENRLIAAQIEAKTAEIELLRLSGRLLNREADSVE
ncbi:TolC family protein [Balneola sp. MJW-20]|uniref:TolC family protein n=1 Tax=Gracilimonas aurantiaca TaxID=3234185 RepID=UPI003467C8D7